MPQGFDQIVSPAQPVRQNHGNRFGLLLLLSLLIAGCALWQCWARPLPVGQAGSLDVAVRLDLNHATASDLNLLPRVGPTLARRIVAFRAASGPFVGVDDLLNVKGVGQKTLEGLRPFVVVGSPVQSTGDD